jgi:hypothetical protein
MLSRRATAPTLLTKYRRERPRQLYEAPHPLVRTLRHHLAHLQLGDGVDVREDVSGNHQGEDMDGDQDRGADGEHHEQPFRDAGRFVYLQLHHGDHGEARQELARGGGRLQLRPGHVEAAPRQTLGAVRRYPPPVLVRRALAARLRRRLRLLVLVGRRRGHAGAAREGRRPLAGYRARVEVAHGERQPGQGAVGTVVDLGAVTGRLRGEVEALWAGHHRLQVVLQSRFLNVFRLHR